MSAKRIKKLNDDISGMNGMNDLFFSIFGTHTEEKSKKKNIKINNKLYVIQYFIFDSLRDAQRASNNTLFMAKTCSVAKQKLL